MALKYLVLTAIAIRLAIGDSSYIFGSSLTFPSEEKNWTVIYTYELDEIIEELSEFKKCVNHLTNLCQSSNSPEKCGTYCRFINKEMEWIEKRLDHIKSYDVMGSKSYNIGRKNTFQMQTIGETTYIKEGLPTTFDQIKGLNSKIDTKMSHVRHINIDDFRHSISTISTIQLGKVHEIATALEYLRTDRCTRTFIPITLERLFSYLAEVEQIIQDKSLYEINFKKINKLSAMNMFDATVINNTFRVNLSIPLKLRDCVRQKTTGSSIHVNVQSSGKIQINN